MGSLTDAFCKAEKLPDMPVMNAATAESVGPIGALLTDTDAILQPGDVTPQMQLQVDKDRMAAFFQQNAIDMMEPVPVRINGKDFEVEREFHNGIIERGYKGVDAATPLNAPGHAYEDGHAAACVVTNGAEGGFKASFITGPLAMFPGDDQDWEAYTRLHENGHCRDAKDGKESSYLGQESYADRVAAEDYYKAYSQGLVKDPEVPYANRAERAIQTMEGYVGDALTPKAPDEMSGFNNYVVTTIAPLPGEKDTAITQYSDDFTAAYAVLDAVSKVNGAVATDVYPEGKVLEDSLKVVKEMADAGMPLDPEIYKEVEARTGLLSHFPSPENTAQKMYDDDLAVLNKIDIPDNLKVEFFTKAFRPQMEALQDAITAQPGLLYEKSREMLAKGEFNDNPAGKEFVQNFVDGAQRYKAEYFGVHPTDQPDNRPAIVDQLAQQYAPGIAAAIDAQVPQRAYYSSSPAI